MLPVVCSVRAIVRRKALRLRGDISTNSSMLRRITSTRTSRSAGAPSPGVSAERSTA
jgi:hypothetical protein